jgi:hypothetical protein
MNSTAPTAQTHPHHPKPALTDINILRLSGIFPQERKPSVRTLHG